MQRATVRELAQGSNFPALRQRFGRTGATACGRPRITAWGSTSPSTATSGLTLSHGGGYPGYGSHVLLLPAHGVASLRSRIAPTPGRPVRSGTRPSRSQKAGYLTDAPEPGRPGLARAYRAVGAVYAAGDVAAARRYFRDEFPAGSRRRPLGARHRTACKRRSATATRRRRSRRGARCRATSNGVARTAASRAASCWPRRDRRGFRPSSLRGRSRESRHRRGRVTACESRAIAQRRRASTLARRAGARLIRRVRIGTTLRIAVDPIPQSRGEPPLRILPAICLLALATASHAEDATSAISQQTPALLETYKDLHAHPELSHHEERTAAHLAKALRAAGYTVTEQRRPVSGRLARLRRGRHPEERPRPDAPDPRRHGRAADRRGDRPAVREPRARQERAAARRSA